MILYGIHIKSRRAQLATFSWWPKGRAVGLSLMRPPSKRDNEDLKGKNRPVDTKVTVQYIFKNMVVHVKQLRDGKAKCV